MGAAKVIAIDEYPTRLALARKLGAEIIDFKQTHVLEALMEMSGGLGPDAVIDAVGMESHGFAPDTILDNIKQNVGMGADSAHALREAIMAVRKGGRVSIPGVRAGAHAGHAGRPEGQGRSRDGRTKRISRDAQGLVGRDNGVHEQGAGDLVGGDTRQRARPDAPRHGRAGGTPEWLTSSPS